MSGAPQARYALYFAPRPDEGFGTLGNQWLGRNAETGELLPRHATVQIGASRLAELTAEARLYGFHGTLKAPIALREGASESDLLAAVGAFATERRPFAVPSLRLASLSGFLALVPGERCEALQDLADSCVIEFDPFRRPATDEELARRRAAGLSSRQESLLERWGYPYVLEEWRFHLTLTGRIADEDERAAISEMVRRHFAGFLDVSLPVRDVCVFRQPSAGRPFTVMARFALGGGRRVRTEVWSAP